MDGWEAVSGKGCTSRDERVEADIASEGGEEKQKKKFEGIYLYCRYDDGERWLDDDERRLKEEVRG